MKKLYLLTISLMLACIFAFTAYAETVVDVSGQIRTRGEGSRTSFDANQEHMQTYMDLRTRVNVKAKVDENAVAFIQFQDSRRLGASGQSAVLNSTANVDLHQAYMKFNLWKNEKWSIGALGGRFEYTWGNQRLMGSVGWHNIGRSWEGGMLWYDSEKFKMAFASLKALEINDPGYNGDFDAYAVTANFKEFNLDLMLLHENNADTSDFDVSNIQELKRTTLAAYYTRKMEQIDFEFNVAIQTGTDGDALTDTEIDLSGKMFAGEVGYSLEGERNARVALGIDYTSGDDGSDPTENNTFSDLYWTGHKFNGYMDYFTGAGTNVKPNGLMDIILRGKFDITNGWTVAGDLHFFSAAEEYMGATEMTKDIGTELDLTIKTTRVKGVALQWGFSIFSAKDEFADVADKQSGIWIYKQATINF